MTSTQESDSTSDSGMSTKNVAAKVGVAVGTIYNWKWRDEEFKAGFVEADRINAENIRRAYRPLSHTSQRIEDPNVQTVGTFQH
jgi:hypothetical protein